MTEEQLPPEPGTVGCLDLGMGGVVEDQPLKMGGMVTQINDPEVEE